MCVACTLGWIRWDNAVLCSLWLVLDCVDYWNFFILGASQNKPVCGYLRVLPASCPDCLLVRHQMTAAMKMLLQAQVLML